MKYNDIYLIQFLRPDQDKKSSGLTVVNYRHFVLFITYSKTF